MAPPSQDNSAELNRVESRPDTAPSGATADMTGAAADAGVLTTAVVAVTAACAGLGPDLGHCGLEIQSVGL